MRLWNQVYLTLLCYLSFYFEQMQDLHAQAVELSQEYPDEAVNIQTRFDALQECWDNLSKMVKEKNESLAEMGELKRFIMSLDEFLNWLTQTSEQCASEELPQSLSEAESILDAHFDLKVKSFFYGTEGRYSPKSGIFKSTNLHNVR